MLNTNLVLQKEKPPHIIDKKYVRMELKCAGLKFLLYGLAF